jgi:hypothetical protein
MNEAALKSKLVKEFRDSLPSYVTIRHEDRFTHGIPDISVTGNKRTTWIEVKYADPNFHFKGIQVKTLQDLARAGFAFFLVYYDGPAGKLTFIVKPSDIEKSMTEWNDVAIGFNHNWIVSRVMENHKCQLPPTEMSLSGLI